jgi:hypothetical protein
MRKIWQGRRAYRLTDEQYAKMLAHLDSELVPDALHPDRTGKRPLPESEKIVLEWLESEKIEPIPDLFQPISVILFLIGAACMFIDYMFGTSDSFVHAQLLLSALTTGAGVSTVTPSQSQVESDVLIGDIDTAQPCQGIKVNVDGDTTMDVQNSQPLVSVLSKLSQLITGTVIGLVLKIATGRVFCKSCVVTFTNSGATTPAVYWSSQKGVGQPGRLIRARTTTINPNSNQTFNKGDYAYLAVTNPANINSFDFTFTDGTQQNMSGVEVDALFAKNNETEANGRLDAVVTTIDNTKQNIQSVRINVGATAVTVMTVI